MMHTATTPQLPPHLHTLEPPPCSVSHFFHLYFPKFLLPSLSFQHPMLLEPSSTSQEPTVLPNTPCSHPIPYILSQAGAAEQHCLPPLLLMGST